MSVYNSSNTDDNMSMNNNSNTDDNISMHNNSTANNDNTSDDNASLNTTVFSLTASILLLCYMGWLSYLVQSFL